MTNLSAVLENRTVTLSQIGSLIALAAAGRDNRKFAMKPAYSGAAVRRAYGVLVIDLRGMTFNGARTPILKNHDTNQIVGQSERVAVSNEGLQVEGFLLASAPAAREVAALSDEGYSWQASVGVEGESFEELREGASATVNGRTIQGPAYIMRKSTLREVSFVPVGADADTAGVALAALKSGRSFSECLAAMQPEREALFASYSQAGGPPTLEDQQALIAAGKLAQKPGEQLHAAMSRVLSAHRKAMEGARKYFSLR